MRAVLTALLMVSVVSPALAQSVSAEAGAHASQAQQAEARNDFATAVREYSLVAKLLPGSAEVQSNLGVALYFAGDKRRALTVLQKAIAINRALFVPHLFSGLAWFQLSEPVQAARELEQAVRLNKEDATAHLWLGYAYSSQAKETAALAEYEQASKLQPENPDAWYALGQTYLKAGEAATRKLLTTVPDGGRSWQLAGEQYLLRGDRAKALTLFQAAVERRPDLVQVRDQVVQLGGTPPPAGGKLEPVEEQTSEDALYTEAHNDEQSAQGAFQKISEVAPDSYRAHQVMGNVFAAQQKPEEAVKEYQAALVLKPDLPDLHEAIGNNLLRAGQPEEALKEFRAEAALQPSSASACEAVGRVLVLLRRDVEAEPVLRRALELNQPPPETYRLLGKIDVNQQKYASAIATLTHYVEMQPDDSIGWYLLAGAYRKQGETAKMQEALDRYKQTSIDSKQRARAKREIDNLGQQSESEATPE